MLDIPSIEFYECQVLDCHCTIIYCRQSLDNEKQYSSLRDRVTLLLGVVTEIIFFGIRVGFIVTYFTDSFSATTAHTVLLHGKDGKKNKHIVGNYSQLILFFTPFYKLELSQHTCVYNLCRTHCQVILLTS